MEHIISLPTFFREARLRFELNGRLQHDPCVNARIAVCDLRSPIPTSRVPRLSKAPTFLKNPKYYYRVLSSLLQPLDPFLSQTDPIRTLVPYLRASNSSHDVGVGALYDSVCV